MSFVTYVHPLLGSDDIDLFRGAANASRKGLYQLPSDEGWDMATATPLFKIVRGES